MGDYDEDDEEVEETAENECCVCGHEWLGLWGMGGLYDFYNCSKCGDNCCGHHYDSDKDMCTDCAEEEEDDEDDE